MVKHKVLSTKFFADAIMLRNKPEVSVFILIYDKNHSVD